MNREKESDVLKKKSQWRGRSKETDTDRQVTSGYCAVLYKHLSLHNIQGSVQLSEFTQLIKYKYSHTKHNGDVKWDTLIS